VPLVKNKENIIVADGSWDRLMDSYLNRSLAVPWTGTLTAYLDRQTEASLCTKTDKVNR
jgi:hypothetical protein